MLLLEGDGENVSDSESVSFASGRDGESVNVALGGR